TIINQGVGKFKKILQIRKRYIDVFY
ncbi:MAG: hypothetical protein ACI93N_000647, partial [Flavobacteriaceae bacterium]